jgi:hypothetical protein
MPHVIFMSMIFFFFTWGHTNGKRPGKEISSEEQIEGEKKTLTANWCGGVLTSLVSKKNPQIPTFIGCSSLQKLYSEKRKGARK